MDSIEKQSAPKNSFLANLQKIALAAAILILVFFLGYIPSCVSARGAREDSARMEKKLKLSDIQGRLGMASYEANRNNYASAAQMSTEFFNSLKELSDTTADDALKPKLQALAARRDEITTNLAQADPAVKEKLAQMYADFFQIANSQH